MDTKKEQKEQKGATKYICKLCDYVTVKKGNYDRHLYTRKHKMIHMDTKWIHEKEPETEQFICSCGKQYKYSQGLSKHAIKCTYVKKLDVDKSIDPTLVMKLINENVNLQKQMTEQMESYQKQLVQQNESHQKQISEMIPCIGNNNNNTTNKFNLNVFLNETCKDAMTLTDFVDNLTLSLTDLERVCENGYMKGTSDIFINGLKQLDVSKRPIHCSDLKRETLYIKNDELDWKKEDTDNPQVINAIHKIHQNNFKQIQHWQNKHPHLMVSDHSSTYAKLISICTNDNDYETGKIVKNIAKESIIVKETN